MKRPGYGKYGVAAEADRTYKGIVYASKAEAKRAVELDAMVRAGGIESWVGQPKFTLTRARIVYIADFHVVASNTAAGCGWAPDWPQYNEWIEEVKGVPTPVFQIKKRLWKHYGTMPLAIISGRKVEWVLPIREPLKETDDAD